ncbi:hypothetical protein BN1723_016135 [Verticillium longisporum]|uniref:Uncharacterized protein n=1 Tax=Verticillium longisporum TaxID=100787 RepID=A0A0G4N9R1_VERLO|nr:hypothetical protein BN1723_016135 [Verticillium longisporum]
MLANHAEPELGIHLRSLVVLLPDPEPHTSIMGYVGGEHPTDWKVTDAPDKYIELLRKSIIGIEIDIDRLEGKFKMSQEMGKGDREGVASGFGKLQSHVAQQIGCIVKQRSDEKDQ